MRAKSLLGLFIFGFVALMFALVRPRATPRSEAAALPVPEKPWLSREASDQIFGAENTFGPLFTGITLGGSPPSPLIRAQIAAFAKKHDVKINFEVVDDELVAVRFEVMFGGCCGYEGVDALASRLARPGNGGGCGMPFFRYDNWSLVTEDGMHMRSSVRVNRFLVRWEKSRSLEDVITRAEAAIGADRGKLADAAGDRWSTIEAAKHYLLEVPYRYANTSESRPSRARPEDRGILLTANQRIVTDATFFTDEERAKDVFVKRWGKPRKNENLWTWYRGDRVITAEIGYVYGKTTVTIARR